jgi:hypothetical protein
MAATLPVPMVCELPRGWGSVSPDEVGAGEAAFVALHPPASNGFTANVTISGEVRPAEVPLTAIADNAVARLRTGARELRVGERSEFGSAVSPGLTQAVRMSVDLHGRPRDLVQLQVYAGFRDTRDELRRVVLHIVLTATPEQFDLLVGDFQQFISTIRPEGETR